MHPENIFLIKEDLFWPIQEKYYHWLDFFIAIRLESNWLLYNNPQLPKYEELYI